MRIKKNSRGHVVVILSRGCPSQDPRACATVSDPARKAVRASVEAWAESHGATHYEIFASLRDGGSLTASRALVAGRWVHS